ncbi:MAG: hypothetical protein J7576_11450, partial [Siphonobacter aquaeclarae]|nr:hypothetical protein [Siphonobacter aquaeclarae]
ITLKTVLHEIQEPGHVFALKFRKLDGDISIKPRVKKNPTAARMAGEKGTGEKKDLNTIRRNMTKAGALLLFDEIQRRPFEVKIELITEYNGYRVFHNY